MLELEEDQSFGWICVREPLTAKAVGLEV